MARRNSYLQKLEEELGRQAWYLDRTVKGYSAKFLVHVPELEMRAEEIKNTLIENNIPFVGIKTSIKHTFRGDTGQVAVIIPYEDKK